MTVPVCGTPSVRCCLGNPGGSADVPALPRLFFRADAFARRDGVALHKPTVSSDSAAATEHPASPWWIAVTPMPSTRSRTLFMYRYRREYAEQQQRHPQRADEGHGRIVGNTRSHDHSPWKMKKSASLTHLRRLHCQHLQFENAPWHPSGRAVGIPRYTAAQSRRTARTIDQDGSVVHACLPARGSSMTGSALAPARRSLRKGNIDQGFAPTPPASGLAPPLGTTTWRRQPHVSRRNRRQAAAQRAPQVARQLHRRQVFREI